MAENLANKLADKLRIYRATASSKASHLDDRLQMATTIAAIAKELRESGCIEIVSPTGKLLHKLQLSTTTADGLRDDISAFLRKELNEY